MDPKVLIDTIRSQERSIMRLTRRCGRAAWHRNQTQAELAKVRDEKETLTAQRSDLTARLRKATQNEGDGEQNATVVVGYAKQMLKEADVVDVGEGLVPMVRGIIRTRDFWQARARGIEKELNEAKAGGLSPEQAKCYDSATKAVRNAHSVLTDIGVADNGYSLTDRMEQVSSEIQSLRTRLGERNEELAAVREQRDRLVSDNTALATSREDYRKTKHEVEQDLASEAEQRWRFEAEMEQALTQAGAPPTIGGFVDRVRHLGRQPDADESVLHDELRQVRHTLSMEQDALSEARREGRLHRDYGFQVIQHSRNIHEMACHAVGLPEDWHQSGPATQGEVRVHACTSIDESGGRGEAIVSAGEADDG